MYLKNVTTKSTRTYLEDIKLLKEKIEEADAIVIGAGAGISTSAGFIYNGETFKKYMFDFIKEYGITDFYSGGFFPFPTKEIMWAFWSRNIYVNRYLDALKDTYKKLLNIVKDKDYFVITTNVDHQFQKAEFDKKRLFYTQGDYGLFQSVNKNNKKTYDNEEIIYKMLEAQGFVKNEKGIYDIPNNSNINMSIPTELIPKCPDDGTNMTLNLRADDNFVEDEGWVEASIRYSDFVNKRKNQKLLLLELGVGMNTPVIIKYPFWKMVLENDRATYACINYNEAFCPDEILDRSIIINEDIDKVLNDIIVPSTWH
ncbi:MAG: hypothetical protein J6M39_05685 [Lachnospiraceae bacterium]|nr:hypothetical protein [Lachnospiraceae bacterium]